MSTITQCPTCNTRFKVTQEQLDAHQGLVRCGRCQAVFNATEFLQDDQSSPQLDLPIAPEISNQEPIDPPSVPVPAPHEELDFTPDEPVQPESQNKEQQNIEIKEKTEPAETITLAQKMTFGESQETTPAKSDKKKMEWMWIAASFFMMIVLMAQTAYFYRVELAANLPGLKPALISYCSLFRCTVPLPQKADLMSIESSELEADPAQPNVITLNALLRNHATYIQAYPNLELTLTDGQDKPLARRIFQPMEYLKTDGEEKQGLAASRELNIQLNLDTTDLKPSGYRLLLFYP